MALIRIVNSSKYFINSILYLSIVTYISTYFSSESFGKDEVVATVGQEKITINEVNLLAKNLSIRDISLPKDQLNNIILRQLINNKILANLARKNDLDKSIEFQRLKNISEDRMLHDLFVQKQINKRVNKDSLKRKYENYISKLTNQEEVRARHILLSSKEDAIRILQKFREGESFSSLAKKNSIGPSANLGGDLGYFTKDLMVEEFSLATFDLKVGEVSNPVKTKFGWHIIKLLDKREIKPPKFDQVEKKLIEDIKEEIYQEIIFLGKKKVKVYIVDKDNFDYE